MRWSEPPAPSTHPQLPPAHTPKQTSTSAWRSSTRHPKSNTIDYSFSKSPVFWRVCTRIFLMWQLCKRTSVDMRHPRQPDACRALVLPLPCVAQLTHSQLERTCPRANAARTPMRADDVTRISRSHLSWLRHSQLAASDMRLGCNLATAKSTLSIANVMPQK